MSTVFWVVVGIFAVLWVLKATHHGTPAVDRVFESAGNLLAAVVSPIGAVVERLKPPEPPVQRWLERAPMYDSIRTAFDETPWLAGFIAVVGGAAFGYLLPRYLSPSLPGWSWSSWFSRIGFALQGVIFAYFAYISVRANHPVEHWWKSLFLIVAVSALIGLMLGAEEDGEDFTATAYERSVAFASGVVVMWWGVIVATIAGPARKSQNPT